MLMVNGEKMSKSLGNFYRLDDIARTPNDFRAFRYMLVTSHYRNTLNFTFESLTSAKSSLRRLLRVRQELEGIGAEMPGRDRGEAVAQASREFKEHLDNDLNTPRAMATVFELVGKVEKSLNQGSISGKSAGEVLKFFNEIDQVLGIFYQQKNEDRQQTELTVELSQLLRDREEARQRQDWEQADLLRDKLVASGLVVTDIPEGTKWSWAE